MTPEQVALVQRSFTDLVERQQSDAMATRFYERLFFLDPDIESLFSTDPAIQRAKFVDELEAIVWAISNLGTLLERTHQLGANHVAYGVATRHYRTVGEALLTALADTLGDAFTPELADAWRVAYNLVAETMMQGADQVDRSR
jgi:hemoglobin-like flavoprotein